MAGIEINMGGDFSVLDRLKAKTASTAASIKAKFSDLGNLSIGAVTAGAAAGVVALSGLFVGLAVTIQDVLGQAGDLGDSMAKIGGSSRGNILIGQKAFELAGRSASDFDKVAQKLNISLGGINEDGDASAEAFANLGLSFETLLAMNPEDRVEVLAVALSKIEDPALRASLAQKAVGKATAESTVAMSNSLDAFAKTREDYGATAEIMDRSGDSLDELGEKVDRLKNRFGQLGVATAEGLLPQLEALAEWADTIDFQQVGTEIAEVVTLVTQLAAGIAAVAKYTGAGMTVGWVADKLAGGADPEAAKKMAESWAANDSDHGTSQADRDAGTAAKEERNRAAADEARAASAAKEADAKAKAKEAEDKSAATATAAAEKSAAEANERRQAAQDAYNWESAILDARRLGNDEMVQALERSKAIADEIQRLKGAGFSDEESALPAQRMVDARLSAEKRTAADEARAKAAADKQSERDEKLKALDSERDRLTAQYEGLRYQGTVAKTATLQRVGGGGGAVDSGLNYQRQANDLLRQLVANTAQRDNMEKFQTLDVD